MTVNGANDAGRGCNEQGKRWIVGPSGWLCTHHVIRDGKEFHVAAHVDGSIAAIWTQVWSGDDDVRGVEDNRGGSFPDWQTAYNAWLRKYDPARYEPPPSPSEVAYAIGRLQDIEWQLDRSGTNQCPCACHRGYNELHGSDHCQCED